MGYNKDVMTAFEMFFASHILILYKYELILICRRVLKYDDLLDLKRIISI